MDPQLANLSKPASRENAARLSHDLSSLYPAGVIGAELRGEPDEAGLRAEEAARLAGAAPVRRREFAGGRLCARRALAALGIDDFALLSADDRLPVWPAGVLGSITHTEGYCAAVVARQGRVRGLGIDCESRLSVKPELWRKLMTPAELALLRSMPQSEARSTGTRIFCAKEAFYKCQYPLTRQYLGFEQVQIAFTANEFEIEVLAQTVHEALAPLKLEGRLLERDQFLIAAVSLRE
jgi:4'-phosphopantetheinyl transferase EntD